MTQKELGELLGVSARTVMRWTDGGPLLAPRQKATLVRAVHARDPALAADIATSLQESLESLGVVTAPPPVEPARPVVSSRDLADSIVCAAAEAAGLTPQAIRPALIAAFDRAASVGLSVEDARIALAPVAAKGKGKGA